MGLTNRSTGRRASQENAILPLLSDCRTIALAGNPNVGKSTVFNALTGSNQHTGNWPGKTVTVAQGRGRGADRDLVLVDIPGTYSLLAHSAEEEVARDFICFGGAQGVAVVCDATCLERNLNLVLQTIEITPRVVVCVNLLDEARRRNISIDLPALSEKLGVPVVGAVARRKATLRELTQSMRTVTEPDYSPRPLRVRYCPEVEHAIEAVQEVIEDAYPAGVDARWLALRLLEGDASLTASIRQATGCDIPQDVQTAIDLALASLGAQGIDRAELCDRTVSVLVQTAQEICREVVCSAPAYHETDRRIDRILTGKKFGYPAMIALLCVVFWITLWGANLPSQALSDLFVWLGDGLRRFLQFCRFPDWLTAFLTDGVYRVLSWVVSVMLPPMAIFFPLFTLLEDVGYLPRVAYNLDRPFCACHACGKQALSMCMGFGCNAAGVVGCRIIDSPRERLLAILTNTFVPCNGRFPALIAILTMFFAGCSGSFTASVLCAILLCVLILAGIGATFGITRLLSATVLRGMPSSFTLELPPYRRPQVGRIIVRSVRDRTLFVLGRAAAVAAPAGAILFLLANVAIDGQSLLSICAAFLDPVGRLLGMDGVILIAFILGFPANEIVIPIILMAYSAQGALVEMGDLSAVRGLLISNGWTVSTALCTMLFFLFHWPCSTTVLTIRKETASAKWTALAVLIPTAVGVIVCMAVNALCRLFVI